jgi:hypothetical protein
MCTGARFVFYTATNRFSNRTKSNVTIICSYTTQHVPVESAHNHIMYFSPIRCPSQKLTRGKYVVMHRAPCSD